MGETQEVEKQTVESKRFRSGLQGDNREEGRLEEVGELANRKRTATKEGRKWVSSSESGQKSNLRLFRKDNRFRESQMKEMSH